MELTQGFNVGPESGGYVLELQKNLYSLKQAGHKWFEKISSTLGNLLVIPSKLDPCVFIGEEIFFKYTLTLFCFFRDTRKDKPVNRQAQEQGEVGS